MLFIFIFNIFLAFTSREMENMKCSDVQNETSSSF